MIAAISALGTYPISAISFENGCWARNHTPRNGNGNAFFRSEASRESGVRNPPDGSVGGKDPKPGGGGGRRLDKRQAPVSPASDGDGCTASPDRTPRFRPLRRLGTLDGRLQE